MDPEYWGSSFWKSLNCIVLTYPKNPSSVDKINYRKFFMLLQYVLPCKACSINFNRHLYDLPLTDQVLSSKYTLLKWLIDLHNEVNKDNNKPVLNYNEATNEIYDDYNNYIKNKYSKNSTMFYIIVTIVVVFIILFLYFTFKK